MTRRTKGVIACACLALLVVLGCIATRPSVAPLVLGRPTTPQTVPIVILCFNNYLYVAHTLAQFSRFPQHHNQIRILDNASTDPLTLRYLRNLSIPVIYKHANDGPWLSPTQNRDMYDALPDQFVLTDPDLQFHPQLPLDFMTTLFNLSDQYRAYKVGFALDISDPRPIYPDPDYNRGYSIKHWEARFWTQRLAHPLYELYDAGIDTTFALINKQYWDGIQIRIAGNFTATHLPWLIDNPILTVEDQARQFSYAPHSTTARLFNRHHRTIYV